MRQLIDQVYIFLLADLRINRIGTAAIKAMAGLACGNLAFYPVANQYLALVCFSHYRARLI